METMVCVGCESTLSASRPAVASVLDTENDFGLLFPCGVLCRVCADGVEEAVRQLFHGVVSRPGQVVSGVRCPLCGGQQRPFEATPGPEDLECSWCGYDFEVNVVTV
jgi:hypothetical protein